MSVGKQASEAVKRRQCEIHGSKHGIAQPAAA